MYVRQEFNNLLKNLVEYVKNLVKKLCGKFFEKFCRSVWWENCVKGVSKKCFWKFCSKICWPDYVENEGRKKLQESWVEKWYETIGLEFVFEKLDDQFGEKFYWEIWLNNQVYKLAVKK